MELHIELNSPPFSINNYYYKTRQRTKEARLWANDVFRQIHLIKDSIIEFRNKFNANEHGLEIDLKFIYPKSIFLNKENTISARTMDLSNVEKPIIDLLTQTRYAERPVPEGAENLRIDDRYIIALKSTKTAQNDDSDHKILITLRIVSLNAK